MINDVMSICFLKKIAKNYICEYNLGWGLMCFTLKPCSIIWLLRFLIKEYEEDLWVENFPTIKDAFFRIVKQL
jgi:hypothetical protein